MAGRPKAAEAEAPVEKTGAAAEADVQAEQAEQAELIARSHFTLLDGGSVVRYRPGQRVASEHAARVTNRKAASPAE